MASNNNCEVNLQTFVSVLTESLLGAIQLGFVKQPSPKILAL